MNRFTSFAAWAALISILAITGCQKEPYIPPFESPIPKCTLYKYTCTIDNDVNDKVTGYVTVDSNYYDIEITDDSDWGEINYAIGNSTCEFSYFTVSVDLYFNSNQFPGAATYSYSSFEEDITSSYDYNTQALRWVNMHYQSFSNFNEYDYTIDSIVFEDGNVKSYVYIEALSDYPYTEFTREKYEFDYDLSREYRKEAYPNSIFHAVGYRHFLSRQYSFGEKFDPQYFCKNLITRKRNVTLDEVVLQNNYKFDSEGYVTELTQDYLYGASTPTNIKWTYQYNCD